MTDQQIATFLAISSNDLLRAIVAGQTAKRRLFLRAAAARELARRDRLDTFGR